MKGGVAKEWGGAPAYTSMAAASRLAARAATLATALLEAAPVGAGAGPAGLAATELRREELDQPLGFQLAAGRAAAAAAAAELQRERERGKPAAAFDDDGPSGSGRVGGGAGGPPTKKSKIEELMEKVGGSERGLCLGS